MPHASLTILQVTYQGDGAGSTQSIFNLSQHLARRGHRVLVGCRAESLLARLAAGARDGLEVVPLDFRRLGALAASLADVVARRRVDVVNSHATRDRLRSRASASTPTTSCSPWRAPFPSGTA